MNVCCRLNFCRPNQHTLNRLQACWGKKWSWDALESLLPFSAASLVQWWQRWCTSSGLTVCCKTQSWRRPGFLAWRPFRPHRTAPEPWSWGARDSTALYMSKHSFGKLWLTQMRAKLSLTSFRFPSPHLSRSDFPLSHCLCTVTGISQSPRFAPNQCFPILLEIQNCTLVWFSCLNASGSLL